MNFTFKQKRGVDDTEKLPYYPYRDDGKLLYHKLNEFADAFIDAYVTQQLLTSFTWDIYHVLGKGAKWCYYKDSSHSLEYYHLLLILSGCAYLSRQVGQSWYALFKYLDN